MAHLLASLLAQLRPGPASSLVQVQHLVNLEVKAGERVYPPKLGNPDSIRPPARLPLRLD